MESFGSYFVFLFCKIICFVNYVTNISKGRLTLTVFSAAGYGRPEITHCRGKYHCMTGLKFDRIGFDQQENMLLFVCSKAT